MKKFVCSIVLVFAGALICAACGSAEKKNGQNEIPRWLAEWVKSKSSDDEICAVGESPVRTNFNGTEVRRATIGAQNELCRQLATGESYECNLPPSKTKGMRQSKYVNENGESTLYVIVCINRKDLEENKEKSEAKTDEDKVVQ